MVQLKFVNAPESIVIHGDPQKWADEGRDGGLGHNILPALGHLYNLNDLFNEKKNLE